jgi:hypothetical protein
MSTLLLTLPLLEHMQSIAGWLEPAEADLLIAGTLKTVTSLPLPHTIVEIGSFCGRSTVVLASVVQALSADGCVYAIDPHEGEVGAADQEVYVRGPTLETFLENITTAGVSGSVRTICQRSTDVTWSIPISFLFVDGLHDYAHVAADFRHFERFLVDRAYVAFHDYAEYYPGVVRFVDELIASTRFYKLSQVSSMILVQRAGDRLPEAKMT